MTPLKSCFSYKHKLYSFIPLYVLKVCSYFIHTDLYKNMVKMCLFSVFMIYGD